MTGCSVGLRWSAGWPVWFGQLDGRFGLVYWMTGCLVIWMAGVLGLLECWFVGSGWLDGWLFWFD